MIKRIFFVFLIGTLLLFTDNKVLAGGFNLTSIGGVDTSGRQLSQWWYSGSSPVFIGEAGAGASVEIDIDREKGSAVADDSGNWSYSSPSLSDGDHQVLLTSSESTISFTLTTGVENVNWDAVNSDSGTEALPAAGIIWPGLIVLITGAGGIVGGGKMIRASKK